MSPAIRLCWPTRWLRPQQHLPCHLKSTTIRHTWSFLHTYKPHHHRTFTTDTDTLAQPDVKTTIGTPNNPLCVCVIGSGPSGMYTVKALLNRATGKPTVHQPITVHISIIERLPVVFGLVRSGVAPDHVDVKAVQNEFITLLNDNRVSLYANTHVLQSPTDTHHHTHTNTVTLQQLQSYYHAVVLAYGAQSENQLTVPGANLHNIYTAQQFVRWYNAYPYTRDTPPFHPDVLQQTDTAVVVGSGNVALDVSRILLSPTSRFGNMQSDLCQYALDALSKCTIQTVHLLSRRGAAQSAFTIDQIRQLRDIKDIRIVIDPQDLILQEACVIEMQSSRAKKRKYDLLKQIAADSTNDEPRPGVKTLYIKFFASPTEFAAGDNDTAARDLQSVSYERTQLQGDPDHQRAVSRSPPEHHTVNTKLVVTAIGSVILPIAGVPFDAKLRVVPNVNTRVVHSMTDNRVISGMYVVGWLRRGPSGIIGTNIPDGKQCAAAIVDDMQTNTLNTPTTDELPDALQRNSVVQLPDWQRIEAAEVERGAAADKPREKIYDADELVETAMRHRA